MKKVLDYLSAALRSKTIIVNVAVILGSTLVYLTNHELMAQYPDVTAWFATALGFVNVVLRMLTGEPLSAKIPQKQ